VNIHQQQVPALRSGSGNTSLRLPTGHLSKHAEDDGQSLAIKVSQAKGFGILFLFFFSCRSCRRAAERNLSSSREDEERSRKVKKRLLPQ